MSHYKSNLRDVEFNLFEYLKVGDHYGVAPFDSFDSDTAMDALREVDRLAREDFGASFVDSDRIPIELIDGEVWGRGAIDMLNLTSSMAVAFRRLAREGFTPKGDLIFFGVGDEEAGGVWGAEWMAEHHWDDIDADYVLTELGGWSHEADDGSRQVTVNVNEKGMAWRRLRVRGRRRLKAPRGDKIRIASGVPSGGGVARKFLHHHFGARRRQFVVGCHAQDFGVIGVCDDKAGIFGQKVGWKILVNSPEEPIAPFQIALPFLI